MIDKVLLIPDCHAQAGVKNDRFSILGAYIAHKKFDVIIQIGDFADMSSLCSYDKGKRKAEGQRYERDIAVAIDANEKLFKDTHTLNKQLIRQGKPQYKPKKYLTLGNHEQRIIRASSESPHLWGTLAINDLEYEKFGWQVIPFLEPLVLEGCHFMHYFPAGLKEMPISGEGAARRLCDIDGTSHVSGHSHLLQAHYQGKGRPRWGLVGGCFLDPDQQIKGDMMEYVSQYTKQSWWSGVVILHSLFSGSFHPVFVPYAYLAKKYG
jgi:Calcineurin-like phosphoesterase